MNWQKQSLMLKWENRHYKAYETLMKYKNNVELRNAVIKLKNTLDNDKNINIITKETGLNRHEIREQFEEIAEKGAEE